VRRPCMCRDQCFAVVRPRVRRGAAGLRSAQSSCTSGR
jgi:hypothetical protein